jgi:2-iminobutanoate/2-iminopropanoate deaminase
VFLGLHRGFGNGFPEQMAGTLDHLARTLDGHGLTLNHLVKVHVWLKDINDLPSMEQYFSERFPPDDFPARMTSTTQFIDQDCLVMVDGVAFSGDRRT